ncbi:MAG: T9SS type A sorting domain-containing protein [Bacteroidota bacterium]
MKTLISLLLMSPLLLWAQNNPIFQGGSNDGASETRSETNAHNAIFSGTTHDGYAQSRAVVSSNSRIYFGGSEDGYSVRRVSRPYNNGIFNGGADDGYHSVHLSRMANNPIYVGGIGDGYDRHRVERSSHNAIFVGGSNDGYDQFRLIGIPPSVNPNLPLEILNFEAWWEQDQVALYWVTASEDNVKYFEVERSTDARLFSPIVRRGAEGNAQSLQAYEDFDLKPLYGRTYYRLKAVDLDGSLSYSPIVSVQRALQANWELSVFPNPSRDRVALILNAEMEQQARIILTDLLGRQLSVPRRVNQTKHQLKAEIDLSQLASGIYVLSVYLEGTKVVLSEKVYKQ